MDSLKERIRKDGQVIGNDILKVDSFLNHQLDPEVMREIGHEFAVRFRSLSVTKILTIEASGIACALMTGLELGVPVLFAKKMRARTQGTDVHVAQVTSYTKGETVPIAVSKRFLSRNDRVLIIDDFLAMGEATSGLMSLVEQAGATLVGIGIVVEKGFQPGGSMLRERGVNLQSLVILESLSESGITYAEEVSVSDKV